MLLLLGSCGESERSKTELSADEERQLDDAAAMLDEPAEDKAGDADEDERE